MLKDYVRLFVLLFIVSGIFQISCYTCTLFFKLEKNFRDMKERSTGDSRYDAFKETVP